MNGCIGIDLPNAQSPLMRINGRDHALDQGERAHRRGTLQAYRPIFPTMPGARWRRPAPACGGMS